IDGLVNVVAVDAGDNHSLALDREGNVWAWGKNNLYQLGNGSTTGSNVPVKVITGGIKAISAAADHSIALKNDGTVLGWGADGPATYFNLAGAGGYTPVDGHTPGQLYYGTPRPAENYPLTGVKGIATSRLFSAYLFDDGRICRIGRFVDEGGATTYTPMPQYSSPLGIGAIAAGENFLIAWKEDGTVLTFGDNNLGQFGDNTQGNGTPAQPRPYGVVTGLNNVVSVAAGGYHGLALDQDGNVYTWGKNLNGQLGTGKTNISLTPVKVAGLTEITAIGGGTESSMAFRNMQKVYVWGNNDYGQLGNDSKASCKLPALAKMTGYDVDTDAPVWPAYFALLATDVTENSITILWSPAVDNIGVTGYEIYIDGAKVADVDGTTQEYTAGGLTAGRVYTFGLKARDAAGNASDMVKTLLSTKTDPSGGGSGGSGTGKYTVTPVLDEAYDNGETMHGIDTMTVRSGVSGFKYFTVNISPVVEHPGSEKAVFVLFRNGVQMSLSATGADFDLVPGAVAGFNVRSGDVVKVYLVDDLSNAADFNPTILE
ncbi:MAG: fibronectin type III domain-containing protein, partial [Desulfotomaculaceae bacterium]|nr:fibronectin type III domain-containing protein [Desulfotomaculaceae bacterium]